MGITIELEIDLFKNTNLNMLECQRDCEKIAEQFYCIDKYFLHELEGVNNQIKKHRGILIIEFEEDLKTILDFLNKIKNSYLKKIILVDNIYNTESKLDIIYSFKKENNGQCSINSAILFLKKKIN